MKVTLNRGEPQQFTINGKGAVEFSIASQVTDRVDLVLEIVKGYSIWWNGGVVGRRRSLLTMTQGSRVELIHDESGAALEFECLEIRRGCIVLDVEETA